MGLTEPRATAVLLAAAGVLVLLAVLSSRLAGRLGVPIALLFIGVGMLSGSEGFGGIHFDDYSFTFRLGTIALVLILFDGGLNTPLAAVKIGLKPALVLATFGVVGTAAVMAGSAYTLGFGWPLAMLLGAIVSSTDAATVFSVLRGNGIHLKHRIGATLELESGLNDPMAVLLTVALTGVVTGHGVLGPGLILEVIRELVIGAAAGLGLGQGARLVLRRLRLPAAGLYPVFTLALAFLAFGLTTLLHGSGFLAVYLCGIWVGNEAVRYRTGLLKVHDAIAWLAQVGMFLLLGLLVFPSKLGSVAIPGLILGLLLAFVARPVVTILGLLPLGFSLKESSYLGWVGLRGAVPIILATVPVMAKAPGAVDLFHLVFFIVVVNAIVPGSTIAFVTRKLGLAAKVPPAAQAVLEITSTQLLQGELESFYISPASAVVGATLADLPFPATAVVTLIVRGTELVPPRGGTAFVPGDHVYVFCKKDDLPLVQLIFGQAEAHD